MTYRDLPEGFAPVQGDLLRPADRPAREPGMIEWAEHLEVWRAYVKLCGADQTAERLAERGGFGFDEAAKLLGRELRTWCLRPAAGNR